MRYKDLHTAVAATIAALSLAACGVPSGSSTSTTATAPVPLTGTVADGYVAGARVFVDKNDNGIFDVDEPSAVSDATGKFSITDAKPEDAANYRLIAIVPKTATDADVGGLVPNAYYLSFPKGGPTPPFVSALSTLVDMKMKVSGLSKDEAFAGVASALGVPGGMTANDALNADFVAIAGIWGGGATAVAQKLQRISRVLVNGMGKALDDTRATMNVAGDTATSPNPANEVQRFKLVMTNILGNLDAVVGAASALPETLNQVDVASAGAALEPLFIGQNLNTQAMIVGQVAQALEPSVASMALNDMPDDIYALRGRSGGQYDLARMFSTATSGAKTIGSLDPVTGLPVASTTALYLSATGGTSTAGSTTPAVPATWVAASELFGSPWAEGAKLTTANTGGVIAVTDGPGFRLTAEKYSLAGKSLDYVLVNNDVTASNGFVVAGAFPGGSEAFRLSFLVQDDSYVLPANSLTTADTSIMGFLGAYPTTGTAYYAPGDGQLLMQFSASGAIWFFAADGTRLAPDGQWKTETVRGKELLKLTVIPDHFKIGLLGLKSYHEPFVALDTDGRARFGVMLRKGAVIEFAGYVFNKTALNAFNAANGLALIP